ncbi:MAG: hypothetical protein PHR25_03080 [Clostridia bacterium]|nr:hypothetical protein [Clostridia bacterium]MDD4375744.1 hypothetical protein [Clostridia bacterium]
MKNKNKKLIRKKDKNFSEDEYGFDFVPTLSHWTNIDEQKEDVEKMESITKDTNFEK